MDQEREIRFVIPPFFLFASLLWGRYLAHGDLPPIFRPETAKEVLGLLAATAVIVIPVGYLISTISVNLLRGIALIARTPTYEAVFDEETLGRIWVQLGAKQAQNKAATLYAATTFDHELLSEGVHMWLLRRWNSFNVAASSIVALSLALLFAPVFSIGRGCGWWLSTFIVAGILLVTAYKAWREVMGMIEFQSYRQQNDATKHKPASIPDI